MKSFKTSRFFLLIIALGLIAGLVISFQRYQIERSNKTVELVLDYEDVLKLAATEGLPPSEVLAEVKKSGITSLAVYETTFKKLNANGKAAATPGSLLIERYHNGSLMSPAWREMVAAHKIKASDVYVTGNDPKTFSELKEDLVLRLGKSRVQELQIGNEQVLQVKASYDDFLKLNMGMPTDEMKAVNAAGFYVLARPSNYKNVDKRDIDAVFDRLKGIRVSDIVFSGPAVLGAPNLVAYTAKMMNERHITLGMIENVTQLRFYPQKGLIDLVKDLDYRGARLYTIPKDEQPKLKMSTAVERWSNSDEERNIRIDLLRPYEKPAPGMSLLATNLEYFSKTRAHLIEKGFKIGPASTFPVYDGNVILHILLLWGVCAAGVVYLSQVVPNFKLKYQYGLFILTALICTVPLAMGHGNKIRVLGALASANLFPALAMIFILWRLSRSRRNEKSSVGKIALLAIVSIVVTSAISLMGAAYVSGILADTRYFMEIDIFRGIKLTFIMPIILVGIALLQRFNIFDDDNPLNSPGLFTQLKEILDAQMYVKTFVTFLCLLFALFIFIKRSGNSSGIFVPGFELKIRAFLEQTFYARPRSKEIFIGHPAFFLMVMAWLRKWPSALFGALAIVATIGQGSMVETFAHMRTPVYMSFMRGVDGVMLGIGFGLIAIFGLQVIWRLAQYAKRRRAAGHE